MLQPNDLILIRKEFDEIDQNILILLGKRQLLSQKIALLKQKNDTEIVQKDIWDKKLKTIMTESTQWQLDKTFISNIFTEIHAESVRIQMKELEK